MNKFNDILIKSYLISRNWKIEREGKMFYYFKPPVDLKLPENYLLEIPRLNSNNVGGFDNYINRLIFDLSQILPNDSNADDLSILFSKENSILRYRIFDNDNADGTISFQKHIDSLDIFKKILSQAVTFTSSSKPIFGDAKFEVESYLNRCRSLQTEKGSYVTKIEIPNDKIYSTIDVLETTRINNKLFDVLEFVDSDILHMNIKPELNENYLEDRKAFLNFELLNSIKEIYVKTKVNNIEFQLSSNSIFRKVETTRVQPQIRYFSNFLNDLKKLLLEVVPLEAIGHVKRLTSLAPQHSNKNEVIVDAEIANNKESIKIILRSEEYLEAIEAHRNEFPVRIKGKAIQLKKQMVIKDLEVFEVIK